MKKTLGIIALLVVMVMVLTACGPNIEGTWKLTEMRTGNNNTEQDEITKEAIDTGMISMEMTFKNGKVTGSVGMLGETSQADEGTYKISGNKITLNMAEEATWEFKLNGDTLELITEEGTLVLTRQK